MNTSESIANIAEALRLVQAQVPPIPKDKKATVRMRAGGTYEYTYADLGSIVEALKHPCSENGISWTQETVTALGNMGVTVGVVTRILHTSGEWIELGRLLLPVEGDARAIGSAITYARRYALTAAFGIVTEDDDDAKATERAPAPSRGTKRAASTASTAPGSQPGGAAIAGESASGKGVRAGAPQSTPSGEGVDRSDGEPGAAEAGGEGSGLGAPPASVDSDLPLEHPEDMPATHEQWAEAKGLGLTGAKVLRLAKARWDVSAQADVKEWQLDLLIAEAADTGSGRGPS